MGRVCAPRLTGLHQSRTSGRPQSTSRPGTTLKPTSDSFFCLDSSGMSIVDPFTTACPSQVLNNHFECPARSLNHNAVGTCGHTFKPDHCQQATQLLTAVYQQCNSFLSGNIKAVKSTIQKHHIGDTSGPTLLRPVLGVLRCVYLTARSSKDRQNSLQQDPTRPAIEASCPTTDASRFRRQQGLRYLIGLAIGEVDVGDAVAVWVLLSPQQDTRLPATLCSELWMPPRREP